MTILDQMAESVQLDYTEQFSTDVEPSSSGLLDLEPSKVCFDTNSRVFYHTVKPRCMKLLGRVTNLPLLNFFAYQLNYSIAEPLKSRYVIINLAMMNLLQVPKSSLNKQCYTVNSGSVMVGAKYDFGKVYFVLL